MIKEPVKTETNQSITLIISKKIEENVYRI